MDMSSVVHALIGGSLIGLAAGVFLILNGRIAGISGVLGGLLWPSGAESLWRAAFIGGLVAGGVGLLALFPSAYPDTIETSSGQLLAAGVLVGIGTCLGNGCTSGHGVCGVARLSPRSVTATVTFIATGAVTVFLTTHILGG